MRPRLLGKLAATAAVTLSLALTGCSSSSDDGAAATSAAPLGTVETMYGTVTVPAPADGAEPRVVALGWSDAEMALALGIKPVAVFDWQGFGEADKGVGPWATAKFGDVTPTVIPNTTQDLNYEQIQGLDPDVILNVRAAANQTVYDRLSSIAPTIYAPTGTPDFATAWTVQMKSIAGALGRTADGDNVIADVEGQIDAAKAANPDFAGKTTVSGTKFGDAYGAYLAGDLRFDLLADLGFVQNPPVLQLPANGFYAAVSAEQVSALDADTTVILPIGFTLAQTEGDKLLQSLQSVKDGRAVFIDPDSELAGAWSAGSALSIPVALNGIVPQLQTAVANLK